MNCPECNAPEMACETRYHECLAKEFSDRGYGAVHNLTVATYMLQHSSKLTREGWLETRRLLKEFLAEKKPSIFGRKQNKSAASGQQKITSGNGVPKINKSTWIKTIMDIRMQNAKAYCADVTAWAKSALEEAEGLKV